MNKLNPFKTTAKATSTTGAASSPSLVSKFAGSIKGAATAIASGAKGLVSAATGRPTKQVAGMDKNGRPIALQSWYKCRGVGFTDVFKASAYKDSTNNEIRGLDNAGKPQTHWTGNCELFPTPPPAGFTMSVKGTWSNKVGDTWDPATNKVSQKGLTNAAGAAIVPGKYYDCKSGADWSPTVVLAESVVGGKVVGKTTDGTATSKYETQKCRPSAYKPVNIEIGKYYKCKGKFISKTLKADTKDAKKVYGKTADGDTANYAFGDCADEVAPTIQVPTNKDGAAIELNSWVTCKGTGNPNTFKVTQLNGWGPDGQVKGINAKGGSHDYDGKQCSPATAPTDETVKDGRNDPMMMGKWYTCGGTNLKAIETRGIGMTAKVIGTTEKGARVEKATNTCMPMLTPPTVEVATDKTGAPMAMGSWYRCDSAVPGRADIVMKITKLEGVGAVGKAYGVNENGGSHDFPSATCTLTEDPAIARAAAGGPTDSAGAPIVVDSWYSCASSTYFTNPTVFQAKTLTGSGATGKVSGIDSLGKPKTNYSSNKCTLTTDPALAAAAGAAVPGDAGAAGLAGQIPGAAGLAGQIPGAAGLAGQIPGAAGLAGQIPGAALPDATVPDATVPEEPEYGEEPLNGEVPLNGEPVEGNGEVPVEGNGEVPVEGNGEPVEGNGEPVEGNGEPVEGNGEPVEGNGEPVEGNGEPVEGNGEPVEGNGEPVEGNGEPVEGNGELPPAEEGVEPPYDETTTAIPNRVENVEPVEEDLTPPSATLEPQLPGTKTEIYLTKYGFDDLKALIRATYAQGAKIVDVINKDTGESVPPPQRGGARWRGQSRGRTARARRRSSLRAQRGGADAAELYRFEIITDVAIDRDSLEEKLKEEAIKNPKLGITDVIGTPGDVRKEAAAAAASIAAGTGPGLKQFPVGISYESAAEQFQELAPDGIPFRIKPGDYKGLQSEGKYVVYYDPFRQKKAANVIVRTDSKGGFGFFRVTGSDQQILTGIRDLRKLMGTDIQDEIINDLATEIAKTLADIREEQAKLRSYTGSQNQSQVRRKAIQRAQEDVAALEAKITRLESAKAEAEAEKARIQLTGEVVVRPRTTLGSGNGDPVAP